MRKTTRSAALLALVLALAGASEARGAGPELPSADAIAHSILGDTANFRKFAVNGRWIDRFLGSFPVKTVLGSPRTVKLLASRGAIEAFVATPAMQSRRMVAVLVRSPLMRKLLACDGVRALANDPDFASTLTSSPAAMRWLSRNPAARGALKRLSPSLAGALSPAPSSLPNS